MCSPAFTSHRTTRASRAGGRAGLRAAESGRRVAGLSRTLRLIRRLSTADAAVLIQGETGTGKELAARASLPRVAADGAVHSRQLRRPADSLVESEFFGHTRGAFTDAKESRAGLIEQAEGGTLFLDELEALSRAARSRCSGFCRIIHTGRSAVHTAAPPTSASSGRRTPISGRWSSAATIAPISSFA